MDKNTLRLSLWEHDFMLFFSEVSPRNALSFSDSSPLLCLIAGDAAWYHAPNTWSGNKEGKTLN